MIQCCVQLFIAYSKDMQIKLFKSKIIIRMPVVLLREGEEEIVSRLSEPQRERIATYVHGYQTNPYTKSDDSAIMKLYKSAGFDFSRTSLLEALHLCIPGGIRLVQHVASEKIVAIMMYRHVSSRIILFGGRIDWLATDPKHAGRGLGKLAATLATNHLISRKFENIWVTTHQSRPVAIKKFKSLGYEVINHPCFS